VVGAQHVLVQSQREPDCGRRAQRQDPDPGLVAQGARDVEGVHQQLAHAGDQQPRHQAEEAVHDDRGRVGPVPLRLVGRRRD